MEYSIVTSKSLLIFGHIGQSFAVLLQVGRHVNSAVRFFHKIKVITMAA